jgi:non-specific protein-tyrosine kinase
MSDLITLNDPRSAASEAYQSLRTNLEFSALDRELHAVLLTSADATTEKSEAVANLAVVMAQAGDRVIVIDGDLRQPAQHALFGVSNARGLSQWLADGGELPLLETGIDNLSLLPAGPAPANPVALLSARRLGEVLSACRERADYILVDAPPALAVTDAALWASQVDGVVLLLNAGNTKRDAALRAKAVLEKVQARIVGAVLLNADRDALLSGYTG